MRSICVRLNLDSEKVFKNLELQDKDDSKTNISFGEFVSTMWIEHQVLARNASSPPHSKRSVIDTDRLIKKKSTDTQEDSILVPPSLAKYDFNP